MKTFRSTAKQCNFLYETKTSKQIENRTPTRRGFNKVKKALPPPGFKQENKNAMFFFPKPHKNIVEQKGKEMHKHVEVSTVINHHTTCVRREETASRSKHMKPII